MKSEKEIYSDSLKRIASNHINCSFLEDKSMIKLRFEDLNGEIWHRVFFFDEEGNLESII